MPRARDLAKYQRWTAIGALSAGAWCCNLYGASLPDLFSDVVVSPAECRAATDCPREGAECIDDVCVDRSAPDASAEAAGQDEPEPPDCAASDACAEHAPDAAYRDAGDTDDTDGTEEQPSACTAEDGCECTSDEDCTDPKKPACNEVTQSCGECANDEQCGRGKRCDLAAARCVRAPAEEPPAPPSGVDTDAGLGADASPAP